MSWVTMQAAARPTGDSEYRTGTHHDRLRAKRIVVVTMTVAAIMAVTVAVTVTVTVSVTVVVFWTVIVIVTVAVTVTISVTMIVTADCGERSHTVMAWSR